MSNRGVTLIELSVVIVLLGLIIVSTLAGRAFIRQAQLRGLISQYEEVNAAFVNFKYRYKGLPGDLRDAYEYWGTNCAASATLCNGDGDFQVEYSGAATENEAMRAWQHLNLAEMYPGAFTGVAGGSGSMAVIDENIPSAKLKGAGISFVSGDLTGTYTNILNNNWIRVGGEVTDATNSLPKITPKEALVIEDKIDEGTPNYGIVSTLPGSGYNYAGGLCVNGSGSSWSYTLSTEIYTCQILFALSVK